jgi:peptide/nickel transport system ATP-binding protein
VQPLIEAIGLCKAYRLRTGLFARKTIDAVRDVSFRLARGRTLGVVGESGSGKTTLGMLLMHLVEASGGKVLFDGTELLALSEGEMMAFRKRIQLIFQNPYASLNPRFTVGRILIEPMKIHGIGSDERERFERAIALLGRVGMPPDSILKYPHEFSGGQRQRIAIARCLAMRPEIIICDEAVSALDVSVQATVLNLLLDLQDEFQLTYLFISHDLAVVKYMADEIIVMHEGEVVEAGDAEALYAAPAHPYTKKLLSAIPRGYAARGREDWHSLPPASSI